MTQAQTRWLFAALVAIGAFVVTASAAPPRAWAQAKDPKTVSLEHFAKGKTHYDLGRFDEAVGEFQKAYELHQDPVYLFNIAQAHRQKGDAIKAIFFYKRFLAADPANPKRESVEKRIKELEEIAKKQEENRQKPPEDVGRPGDTDTPRDTSGDKDTDKDKDKDKDKPDRDVAFNDGGEEGGEEEGEGDTGRPDDTSVGTRFVRPRPWRLGVEAGPGFIGLGGGPSVPMQVSVRAGVAYSIPMGKLAVDVGAGGTYTPIPYEVAADGSSPVSSLMGVLANVAARYHIGRHLDLRAEVGLGAQWWSGLEDGNRFTDEMAAATGPLPMFLLRLGLGVDYVLDNGLIISATPVSFQYSPPHAGLHDDIGSVTQFDLLVGLGYAL